VEKENWYYLMLEKGTLADKSCIALVGLEKEIMYCSTRKKMDIKPKKINKTSQKKENNDERHYTWPHIQQTLHKEWQARNTSLS
jgi:hypothetical protein